MNDFRMFDSYRKEWTRNTGSHDYCSVDHLLRFWRENKAEYLAPLFGDNLILEQDIVYDKPLDVMRSDMYAVLDKYDRFLGKVIEKLSVAMDVDVYGWGEPENKTADIVWRSIRHSLLNAGALVDNSLDLGYDGYDDNGYKFIKQYNIKIDGKTINLQRGMKTTRAFTTICKAFGMEDEWEQFRIAHSQVLNTKRLTGTLCLSIHPLDYATASDNDNGWSSCMSWGDYGCYRMGTVEMMNSPMVICAYLKSKKQHMEIAGEEWNSKKWRAWIIVTKDVILCNRHYPYHQDEMAIKCINWVRDLVGEKYGWKYEEPMTDFFRWMRDEAGHEVEFHTNYMYNDLGGDDIVGCFKQDWTRHNMPSVINFSGPAECMVCGEEICPDEQDAGQLECDECWCEYRCEECGDSLSEDDIYHGPDGEVLCYDCYNRICVTCACCECTTYRDDTVTVRFPMRWNKITDKQREIFSRTYSQGKAYNTDFHWMFKEQPDAIGDVEVCNDCADKYGVTEVEYPEDNEYGVEPNYYTVPNPNDVNINRMLCCLNAPGYEYANYTMNRINHGYSVNDDVDDAKEYYGAIIEFWEEQWTRFKNEFDNIKKF